MNQSDLEVISVDERQRQRQRDLNTLLSPMLISNLTTDSWNELVNRNPRLVLEFHYSCKNLSKEQFISCLKVIAEDITVYPRIIKLEHVQEMLDKYEVTLVSCREINEV